MWGITKEAWREEGISNEHRPSACVGGWVVDHACEGPWVHTP
jgi:hypothetical protein